MAPTERQCLLLADTVAKVVEATTGARIESDLLVQRIEVAILNSAANQCYAVLSAKYFYNSIGTSATLPARVRMSAFWCFADMINIGPDSRVWRVARRILTSRRS